MGGFSLSAFAYGDDVKKANSKKSIHLNAHKKIGNTKSKDDTLIYDKSVNDTLVFDNKTTDDTLVFSDDEMQMRVNTGHKTNEDILINSTNLNPVIYPNPSLGAAKLELNTADNSTTEIIITSQEGTIIKREYTKDSSYELTNLAAGKYIVTIKNGNQTVQKRLFVK